MVSIEHDLTPKRSDVGYVGGSLPYVWSYVGDSSKIPVFRHKLQGKHKKDLIAALAISGPSTAYSLAKYVLSREGETGGISKRKNIYYKIIEDREEKGTKYLGLISKDFVQVSEISKRQNGKLYFLTLKGCFLAIGYEFNDDELKDFIKNAATKHIFFAYLYSILQKTSLQFVKEIFIKPIHDAIKDGRIFFDQDIRFYTPIVTYLIGDALHLRLTNTLNADYNRILKSVRSEIKEQIGARADENTKFLLERDLVTRRYDQFLQHNPRPEDKEVETLIDNTFYYQNPHNDWNDALIELLNPGSDDEDFYIMAQGRENHFLYEVMRNVHTAYYTIIGFGIPSYPRKKLSRSKRWKSHQKSKKLSPNDKKWIKLMEKNQKKYVKKYVK